VPLTRVHLGLNKAIGYIGKDNFPLPNLSTTLKSLAHELYSGRGFFVIRTLPVDSYSGEDFAVVYAGKQNPKSPSFSNVDDDTHLGLSSHVGSARGRQDDTGAVLAHIKDLSVSHAHEKGVSNSAYTTDKQVFHSDIGDLIALMALQTAAEGGTSKLSSSGCIYNQLAATRPDLIKTLAEPWPLDRFASNTLSASSLADRRTRTDLGEIQLIR
jgi:Taurine catabolism dioxygenase TauD, TfdA family